MNIKIKNILHKLTEHGYQAYVVGGFVRDYILGRETYDVDIATSATPKEVIELLNLQSSTDDNYGSIKFKDSIYNYDITTFRKELNYEDRKPVNYEFTDSIEIDIKRRDFSINSLYMDEEGNIHDIINGQDDIQNKVIKVVGNINDKMTEDPLRILRAIRFASILNFTLDDNLYNYIKQNKLLIRTLSYTRRKDELDKILKGDYKDKGIKLIKELGLESDLEINIPDNLIITKNIYGMYAQMEISESYPFTIKEKDLISDIKKITKYGLIDNVVLYQYGLFPSIVAGELLNVSKSYISDIYKNMPIYSVKDIKITGDDIIDILNIEPSEKIKDILSDLELHILNNILDNNYDEIKEYILKNWR